MSLSELFVSPLLRQAFWGYLVAELDSGQVLLQHHADKLFVPASVTKLFSVAAAMDSFSAEHRFETFVRGRGEIQDGTLNGDLILDPRGDLLLGSRTTDDDRVAFANHDHIYANFLDGAQRTLPNPRRGLDALARQVAQRVKRVTGQVIADDRLFEHANSTGSGPERVTPYAVNDNVVDVIVHPTELGQLAKAEVFPRTSTVTVDCRMQTVDITEKLQTKFTSAGRNRFVLTGQIPLGHEPLLRVHEVADSGDFARSLFIEALTDAGVALDASPLERNPSSATWPSRGELETLPKLATLQSPPFAELAKLILKVSHNLHASSLPLLLAVQGGKRTLEEGMQLQGKVLKRFGIDVRTISFGGAAGGDMGDYLTPRATVDLLRHMATRSDFEAYRDALPILGVDGTLHKDAEPGSPAYGNVRAKTGTLVWDNRMNDSQLLTSKSLGGYMTTGHGKQLAFAIFINHVHLPTIADSKQVGKLLGSMCAAIYDELSR